VTRDKAAEGDNVVEIGTLSFLYDAEMERVLRDYGGIRIGYRSGPWGGGFTLDLVGHYGSNCS